MKDLSPLQEFAELRKSGLYHPDTESNWPSRPKQPEALEPPPKVEYTPPPTPTQQPVVKQETVTTKGWWLPILNLLLIVGIIIYLLVTPTKVTEPTPKPPEVKVKTVTKVKWKTRWKTRVVKKVTTKEVIPRAYRVARENLATARLRIARLIEELHDDPWRKKACYFYKDWDACLAYEKHLPSVVRIGRQDL